MTMVKICGIKYLNDARHAVVCGADYLGFNFVESSPRYISPGAARSIINKIGRGVTTVGIFVHGSIDDICAIAQDSMVDVVQLHGDETSEQAERVSTLSGLNVIKAFRLSENVDTSRIAEYAVEGILLDGFSSRAYGGTGEIADWARAAKIAAARPNIYLAGGLTPANVAEAIRIVRPFAVDVASGVESSPGKKDPQKVEAFIRAAKEAL